MRYLRIAITAHNYAFDKKILEKDSERILVPIFLKNTYKLTLETSTLTWRISMFYKSHQ